MPLQKEHISVEDKDFKYRIFNRKTEFKEDADLFPNPDKTKLYLDIKQGYTDLDCYFLSVVSSLAKTDPEALLHCFEAYSKKSGTNKLEALNDWFKKPDTKKVGIRFFKLEDKGVPSGKVVIEVDKTALRGKGAPWVRLLEKAYAVYRHNNYDHFMSNDEYKKYKMKHKTINSGIIDGIHGGDAGVVMATLTGKKSGCVVVSEDLRKSKSFSGYSEQALSIYYRIEEALDKKQIITADAEKGIQLYSKGLFLSHVYSVIGAGEMSKNGNKYLYIEVRNPYAGRTREYDDKGKSKVRVPKAEAEKGISKLELNDFLKYFKYINIGSTKHSL